MNSDYSNYEMVRHEENLPYTIFVHTRERIENDGHGRAHHAAVLAPDDLRGGGMPRGIRV